MPRRDDKVLEFDDKNLGSRPKKLGGRKKVMSQALKAKMLMRETWPLDRYGKLDDIFYRAVKFISPRVEKDFTQRRARAIWEGAARRIDSDEMDALKAALIEEAHREQQELRARLAALDEKIAAFDARVAREALAHPSE